MAFTLPTFPTLRPRDAVVLNETGGFHDVWFGWLRSFATSVGAAHAQINQTIGQGQSTTLTLAKITPGGTNGSITLVNGVVTAFTAPT